MDIKSLSAIVTGGGTGTGFAIASALKEKGAKVAILGRRKDVIKAAADKIGALGLSCDISDEDMVESMFTTVREAHGPVQILVNCAAIVAEENRPVVNEDGPVSMDWFNRVISVNLTGLFNMTRLAADQMRGANILDDGSRGIIVNISSVSAQDGPVNDAAYAASKGGVNSLTLPLAREFGQFGVRVMTVSPGPIDTPLSRENIPQHMWDALPHVMPFPKRAAEPDEIAHLIVHICENSFLNGEVIRIDGGYRVPFMT